MRIFDYAQPKPDSKPTPTVKGTGASTSSDDANAASPVERRKNQDRRASDRRDKQSAIFLNTRKQQGRRVSHGRRTSDLTGQLSYKPISLKG